MKSIKLRELLLFTMLGCIMFVSKLLLEFLPNFHLVAVLLAVYTVVYRKKAIFPLIVYILLVTFQGVLSGMGPWWIPNLYIWLPVYFGILLVPKSLPMKFAAIIYAAICGLHGFLYGILYAPAQAIIFGLNFKGTIAWIVAGFPFDLIHGISNIILSILIPPLSIALKGLSKRTHK